MDLYAAVGGTAGCRSLSQAFYARVKTDPVLRPLFPGKTMTCAMEEFSAFLIHFLGGPPEEAQRRWWLSLQESHARFRLTPAQRNAWLENMAHALHEVNVADPLKTELLAFFERRSARFIHPAAPDESRAATPCGHHIQLREQSQNHFDEAVAAIRKGDAEQAMHLADAPTLRAYGPSLFAGLLAMMIRSGNERLVAYALNAVTRDPALVRQRFAGRTLLHEASAAACMPAVQRLLELNADANAYDLGNHTPLYSAANECCTDAAAAVIRALASAGADVNASAGINRCTPLHMAARRGNVSAAAALLDCGADIHALDVKGNTPLQRALNCRKATAAEFLRAKIMSVSDV